MKRMIRNLSTLLLVAAMQAGCGDRHPNDTASNIQLDNPSFQRDRMQLLQAGTKSIEPLLDRTEQEFIRAEPPQAAMPAASEIANILLEIDPEKSMLAIDRRFDAAQPDAKFGLMTVASFIGPPYSKNFFMRVLQETADVTFMPVALLGLQPYAEDKDVRAAFQEALRSKDQQIRRSAALVLSDYDPAAIQLLEKDALNEVLPWHLRETAIINIGTSHLPEGNAALDRLAKSKSGQVRSTVAKVRAAR